MVEYVRNERKEAEEYFEADVKPERKSDIGLDWSEELKQEFPSDNEKNGMEEYFETDV